MAVKEELKISPAVIIPIGLGLGLVAAVALYALAQAAVSRVTVSLKNPPSGANYWQMLVCDWDVTKSKSWFGEYIDSIGDPAIIDIPIEWKLPLRVQIGIYYHWYENEEKHGRQLYFAQSLQPYLWDFDKMEWSDEPDPDYREVFIPEYGSYYYNVATEQFEKR